MTKDQQELFIIKSYIKGGIHAIIVPFTIFIFSNIVMEGNFGGLFALTYIAIVGTIYNFSKKHYFSKRGFFYSLLVFCSIIFIYITVGLILSL